MKLDVYHHFPPTDTSTSGKLDQIIALLNTQGAKMSALTDAVDAIQVRVGERIAALQATIADLTQQLIEAMANDAADAATIAEKQAQLDALNAEIQSQVDELNAAFADVPTEPEPTPEPEPEPPTP